MKIAVCTCCRSNGYDYLRATLDDMELQDPSVRDHAVRVFVDELQAPELPDWVSFEAADSERMRMKQYFGLKGCLNVLRALKWLSEPGSGDFAAFFEDDLNFAKDWLKRTSSIARGIENLSHGTAWVSKLEFWEEVNCPLATKRVLLSYFPWSTCPRNVSMGFRKWSQRPDVWGSQSYVMPSRFVLVMAGEIEKNLSSSPFDYSSIHIDHLVLSLCKRSPSVFDVYLADPCLTKHVGEISVAWKDRPIGNYFPKKFDQSDRR